MKCLGMGMNVIHCSFPVCLMAISCWPVLEMGQLVFSSVHWIWLGKLGDSGVWGWCCACSNRFNDDLWRYYHIRLAGVLVYLGHILKNKTGEDGHIASLVLAELWTLLFHDSGACLHPVGEVQLSPSLSHTHFSCLRKKICWQHLLIHSSFYRPVFSL